MKARRTKANRTAIGSDHSDEEDEELAYDSNEDSKEETGDGGHSPQLYSSLKREGEGVLRFHPRFRNSTERHMPLTCMYVAEVVQSGR